ncbi:CDP-glycerol--glycerophosphate glycerophosphotransferase [Salinimicrobium xinjiangense]|uniref:CDP-glycerol--glycerophosphate glycerophosphotransferase n=1 Tax=Salinimicrobium xinjiangense TaxID=438596 RepID=UPI000409FA34|nr:CDP-glycerol--glycerophosphate glycerophosphotransferase [Salinimicrobium xinjiangense]
MKFVLFCQNPYAFGILEPIMQVLKDQNEEYLWFLTERLRGKFPFEKEPYTYDLEELVAWQSDVIFCPGNEVPHYLRGVKVQVFHGLAGEKKGHFRIRHYFDLYLTQGPYFTRKFRRSKRRHKNFEVVETGWPKLDVYANDRNKYDAEKEALLKEHHAENLILYAPTFSPSLTSAPHLLKEIKDLAKDENYLIQVKFHDLMAPEVVEDYRKLAANTPNILLEEEPNIVKYLLMADLMISDTSSVVYEFLLLDKPVITFKSSSEVKVWDNATEYTGLSRKVRRNLEQDPFRDERKVVIEEYHPYDDGRSAERMVAAVKDYIEENGVPERRKLPFLRKRKMNRMFRRKRSGK